MDNIREMNEEFLFDGEKFEPVWIGIIFDDESKLFKQLIVAYEDGNWLSNTVCDGIMLKTDYAEGFRENEDE